MISALLHDDRGAVAIEVAIIAPVLAMLAIGGFDASMMIARQAELQSSAAEAAAIVRATIPEDFADRQVVRGIVATSAGLTLDHVSVTKIFRCGIDSTYTNEAGDCLDAADRSEYIKVRITDIHAPIWTTFGVGSPMNYDVVRTVQVG